MAPGKHRFDIQLEKIQALFDQAKTKENPALWLFLHDLRTPLFMLESLSKIYADIIDKKIFTKLKDRFKEIEDSLGALDYYAAYQREFSTNTAIPAAIKSYISEKTIEKTHNLSLLLKKEGWLNGIRIKKISKKLKDAEWPDEVTEAESLKLFYAKQIGNIQEFVDATEFNFDNIEDDVHELRRKLRWLSIYPQALQGIVKLQEVKPIKVHLKKYLTKEIVTSRFNQLTVAKTQKNFLLFEKNRFLALSWMIFQLGKIKDDGLKIEALRNAIQETELLNDDLATVKAFELLGPGHPDITKLLKEASDLSRLFFKEGNLKTLVL
jgi:hypothetical protein